MIASARRQLLSPSMPRTTVTVARHLAQQVTVKPKVVIIGCGWGGFKAAVDIDKSKYSVELVSPRNHFLFTPLLPSTAVGTLEFHCIQEPVRTIPKLKYHQAACDDIDFASKTLHCVDAFNPKSHFDVKFDILVLAAGCETNTFGVPGVLDNKHVFFLKQLEHSRGIRNRLIECFERASSPGVTPEERQRLLTCVIVGGGPTSVEFAAEVYDFLTEDVSRWYPELLPDVRVKLIEASGHILGSFNSTLVDYTERLFRSRSVEVLTGVNVKEVRGNVAQLSTGEECPFGLMVWSTGVKPVSLVNAVGGTSRKASVPVPVARAPNGRLQINSFLQVLQRSEGEGVAENGKEGSLVPLEGVDVDSGGVSRQNSALVFALGDCAADVNNPLPPLAQVAQQQGAYLARLVNSLHTSVDGGSVHVDSRSSSGGRGAVAVGATSTAEHNYMRFLCGQLDQLRAAEGVHVAEAEARLKDSEGKSGVIQWISRLRALRHPTAAFRYNNMGSMASIGDWKGVVQMPTMPQTTSAPAPANATTAVPALPPSQPHLKGFVAFLLWRAAYWTKSVSLANKMLIPMYWFKSTVFGRDISRF